MQARSTGSQTVKRRVTCVAAIVTYVRNLFIIVRVLLRPRAVGEVHKYLSCR